MLIISYYSKDMYKFTLDNPPSFADLDPLLVSSVWFCLVGGVCQLPGHGHGSALRVTQPGGGDELNILISRS